MFDHEIAKKDIHFYDELKADLKEEVLRSIGPFESIKVFEVRS